MIRKTYFVIARTEKQSQSADFGPFEYKKLIDNVKKELLDLSVSSDSMREIIEENIFTGETQHGSNKIIFRFKFIRSVV